MRVRMPLILSGLPGLLLLLLLSCAPRPAIDTDNLAAGDLRRSGTVHLEVTCKPEVKQDFENALALLHSFFYEEARRRFLDIAERDPDCAMAWWGVAMTWYHPLWAPPTAEEREQAIAALDKAKAIGAKTDLERGLIDSIDTFFRAEELAAAPRSPATPAAAPSCHGPRQHGVQAAAYRDELKALRERFPDNKEVTIFYTLSMLGTAPPTDKTYAQQRAAAAILEPLFENNPDHPGVAHYIIHAYDYPSLASRALGAARTYDEIAPWVPHALHMPTHIYTRLGMWEESIQGNLASSQAARDYASRFHDGGAIMDDLHAMDYLMFAYLQTARDTEARKVLDELYSISRVVPGNDFASAYAIAAMPARFALERRMWEDAAVLDVPQEEFVTRLPFALAHIEFARAVGAARAGRLEAARAAVVRLEQLRDALKDPKFQYWVGQIELQHLSARAWLAQAHGDGVGAESFLLEAAAIEEKAGTHPVTPGQILPTREQLGDLLLELGRPADALVEFEKSLEAFPRRFRSFEGAARSAGKAGKRAVARRHYEALVEMAGKGERAETLAAVAKLVRG